MRDIVRHGYGINLSKWGIRYQLPENKEDGKRRWHEYYQNYKVKWHKGEYARGYNQRPSVVKRTRIKNGDMSKELICVPFVVTDKGNSVVELGFNLDDGFKKGTIMTVLNVINLKGTPNKYEILNELKEEGYFNPDNSVKAFQLSSITRTLKRLEEDGFIEPFNCLPDWLFG